MKRYHMQPDHSGGEMDEAADGDYVLYADHCEAMKRVAQQPQGEPVGHVYTMEALVPGASRKYHAQLYVDLPVGSKLYAEPQAAPVVQRLDVDALVDGSLAITDGPRHPFSKGGAVWAEREKVVRYVLAQAAPSASAQPAAPVAQDQCAQDVYEHGQSIGLFDIPKETANAICAGIAAITGARVDWHYVGGRVHMKGLAAPAPSPDRIQFSRCAQRGNWTTFNVRTEDADEVVRRLLAAHAPSESVQYARREDAPYAPLSVPSASPAKPFQARVRPWMLECFGPEIAADQQERNHRFIEEALELVQACGATASEAHQLVDYVYGRPVGDKHQEAGGVMVTLAALCLAQGLDMHAAGETELARIWTKVEQIRSKQAAKPKHSPLPQHASAEPPAALTDDLRDRLLAIGEAVDDQDDRAAQAMLRETLALLAASPADQGEDAPDMFWNHDDPERCQDSIHNVVVEAYENGYNVGDIVEVQQAIRLHNIKVRIVDDSEDSEEISYELVEDAAMSADKTKG